jgi:hypothetical protein
MTKEQRIKATANSLIDRYDFGALTVAKNNAANGRTVALREHYMGVAKYLVKSMKSLLASLGTDELAKRAMCRAMAAQNGTIVDEDIFDTTGYDPEA